MNHNPQEIAEDRPLTPQEHALVHWLLQPGDKSAASYIPQLATARVVARCGCGCASIDFSVGGVKPSPELAMDILSDYCWRDAENHLFGAFVFARAGLIAGLELWSIDGEETATHLPDLRDLKPLEVRKF